MDKTTNNKLRLYKGIKRFAKWFRRWTYIILAATMIGFSNALNDETRMLNDIRNIIQQEQVMDDEDTLE